MPNSCDFKSQLIEELWLPFAVGFADVTRPRLRKNKKMRVLTLTSHDCQEIKRFEEQRLTKREHVVAWNHQHIKVFRLETDIPPAKVLGNSRYEDSSSSPTFSVGQYFPFDIANLDFSSQDPEFEFGRIEKEMGSLEHTLRLQGIGQCNNFILLYTTILNSNDLSYQNIVRNSNNIYVPEWSGLTLSDFPPSIKEQKEKMQCIETVLPKICAKYHYNGETHTKHISLERWGKDVFSIAAIISKQEAQSVS